MSITVFTRTSLWSLFWARWIQSTTSHPVFLRLTLILSSHLRLGLLSGLLPSGLPTKIFHAFLISSKRAACPAHHILLDLIILIIISKAYSSWSSSLCSLLRLPSTSSPLGPNILLGTLFANTLNLCSSLSVGDRVSQP